MLIPLSLAGFGAWVGSSLALYLDGPMWLALVGSFAIFFLIPLGWELWADRDQRGGRIRDAILRSSVLSVVFIVILVGTHPEATFKALALRGDWWLAGSQTPAAQSLRKLSFTLADGLEWLNDAVRDKPYRESDESKGVDPGAVTAWPSATVGTTTKTVAPAPKAQKPLPIPGIAIPESDLRWPLEATVHPIIARIPDEARKSPQTVGKWLKEQITDPFELTKAVHDFVALHVSYDFEKLGNRSLNDGNQSAGTVFKTGLGVCAGYSRLTVAVGKAAGLNVIYVGGDSRNSNDYREISATKLEFPEDAGHAWNAVQIGDSWYLLDVTWDSGYGSIETGFTRRYQTHYLFTPPEAMLMNHRPDAERWQLVETPLSRAEWLRQPLFDMEMLIHGVSVGGDIRPVMERADPLIVEVANPLGFFVSAHMKPITGETQPCDTPNNATQNKFTCRPLPGRFEVMILARPEKYGTGKWLGSYWIND